MSLRLRKSWLRGKKIILEPLVIAFPVVMIQIISNRPLERPDTEEDHLIQTFILDGTDELLRKGIAIRSLGRAQNRTGACILDKIDERWTIFTIPIDYQKPMAKKESIKGISEIPCYLLHEGFVRCVGDSSEVDFPGR